MSNPISKERLVGLINAANVKQWTPNQLTLGTPTALGSGDYNTSIQVNAVDNVTYTGQVVVRYNRVDLALAAGALSRSFDASMMTSLRDLAAAMSSRYGRVINALDLIDGDLPAPDGQGQAVVTVQAALDSLMWRGGIELTLTGLNIPLAEVITVTDLTGLTLADTEVAP